MHQETVDLGADGDRGERRDRSQSVEIDVDVALGRGLHDDRQGPVLPAAETPAATAATAASPAATAAPSLLGHRGLPMMIEIPNGSQAGDGQEGDDDREAGPSLAGGGRAVLGGVICHKAIA